MQGKRSVNTKVDGVVMWRDMVVDEEEVAREELVLLRGTERFSDIDIRAVVNSNCLYDLVDGELDNENLISDLNEFLKAIRIDFLDLAEYAVEAEEFLSEGVSVEWLTRMEFEKKVWLDGYSELLEFARRGVFEFADVKDGGLIADADALRKYRLMDMYVGGVLRRWMHLKELEGRVVEWMEREYPEKLDGSEWLEWKVARWKKCWRKLSTNQQRMLKE